MFQWLKNMFAKPDPERVEFDHRTIRRLHGSELIEEIAWDIIDEIIVITTDQGPFQEDVFIVFRNQNKDKGIIVPNGADGTPSLVDKLCQMPGFDEKTFIKAMGCSSNKEFLCWRRNNIS